MIVNGGDKTEQFYDGEDRVFMVFHGEDLIYNCYAIPKEETVYISNQGLEYSDNILSNTDWNINN